jgi:hypothetical protein
MVTGLAPWVGDQAARQALWGQTTTGVVARQVTTSLISGAIAFAVPVPGGGWIVGVVERQLVQNEASILADALEAAVREEFGPSWAPLLAVGIAAAVVLVLFVSLRKLPTT